jgi:hypothetical protein
VNAQNFQANFSKRAKVGRQTMLGQFWQIDEQTAQWLHQPKSKLGPSSVQIDPSALPI